MHKNNFSMQEGIRNEEFRIWREQVCLLFVVMYYWWTKFWINIFPYREVNLSKSFSELEKLIKQGCSEYAEDIKPTVVEVINAEFAQSILPPAENKGM